MSIECDPGAAPASEPAPFGTGELLAAVAGARRVLDAACGSGRLTVALALAGAEVTGFDTSSARLEHAPQLAQRGDRVVGGHQREPARDRVERRIVERQRQVEVGLDEL